MAVIDLRSDTVTQPTADMRAVMARAEVGDDTYGEDPTVCGLQESVSNLLGMEAALFFPTCTMANQAAINVLTHHGDGILALDHAHILQNEANAAAAFSGVQIYPVGNDGRCTIADIQTHIDFRSHYSSVAKVLITENTHTASGGRVIPIDEYRALTQFAVDHGMKIHLDGARLFNAAIASRVSAKAWCERVSSVSICFSKGLGAPAGAVLCGSHELVHRARRVRKMLGGAMRQSGVLAAAGRYALENHIDRMRDDHTHARKLAVGIREMNIVVQLPETNIVLFEVDNATQFVAMAQERGVLLKPISKTTVRAVTHLNIVSRDIDVVLDRLGVVVKKCSCD